MKQIKNLRLLLELKDLKQQEHGTRIKMVIIDVMKIISQNLNMTSIRHLNHMMLLKIILYYLILII